MFINPQLNPSKIKQFIQTHQEVINYNNQEFAIFNTALVIDDFFTPESRQLLESQIYSYGKDLGTIYRSTKAPFNVGGEITIPRADQQITLLKELKLEMMSFFQPIFDNQISEIDFQLRELPPNSGGHPRHSDYPKGYSVDKQTGNVFIPISLSLPITDHGDGFVEFEMETGTEKLIQTKPGSIAVFGPKIFHAHPATDNVDEPSLWLVIGIFLKITDLESPLEKPKSEAGGVEKILQNRNLSYSKIGQNILQIELDENNLNILKKQPKPSHAQKLFEEIKGDLGTETKVKIYPGNYATVDFLNAMVKYPTALIIEY
ncbi:MAG: hypothetical protein WCK98_00365 [bacterium]